MNSPKRRTLIWGLILLLGASFAAAGWWLPWLGTFLVKAEPPVKGADAVVVLAGDGWGLRVEKGGELVRDGYAPVALVSGPSNLYGRSESDLAIDWAERQGYDRKYFVSLSNHSTSTEDEAMAMLEEIRKRGYKKLIIVTSNFHTARAGRIWRRQAAPYGIEIHMTAAKDHDFVPDHWWSNREARKKLFFEWMKTLTGPLGV